MAGRSPSITAITAALRDVYLSREKYTEDALQASKRVQRELSEPVVREYWKDPTYTSGLVIQMTILLEEINVQHSEFCLKSQSNCPHCKARLTCISCRIHGGQQCWKLSCGSCLYTCEEVTYRYLLEEEVRQTPIYEQRFYIQNP